MKKMLFLMKSLFVTTLLILTTGLCTAQAQDRTAGDYPPSTGLAPAGTFPQVEIPPPGPLAPAFFGNIYGHEAFADTTARFYLSTPGIIVNIAPSGLGGDFATAGTFGADPNFFYSVAYGSSVLDAVDATTGIRSFIGNLTLPISGSYTGMTYDTTTGTFYLVSTDIAASFLYTVDVTTAIVTVVGQITNAPAAIALAADGSGNLFTYDILFDVGLSVNKATGAGTVLGPLGFNANFAQGMAYDPLTDTIYLAAYNSTTSQAELRSFNKANGSTVLLGAIGPGSFVEFTFAAIPQNLFQKDIVFGNDWDFNGIPDKVVEAGINSGASYGFSISYFNPAGPNVMIKDVVPREWDAFFLGGTPCSVIRADERRNLFSDNYITCYAGTNSWSLFLAFARCGDTPGDPMCHPYECGAFYLNEGARAWVGRALIDMTEPLCLAAVKDLNGFGLVYDGTGDEDGDGVDDYTEACVNFTDPCDPGSNSPGRR